MSKLREVLHVAVWVKRHLRRALPAQGIERVRPHIAPDDVLLDVGAHAGSWTVPLSRMVPRGRVFAFEALPYYARVLRATLRVLGRRNVEVVGRAVLEADRSVEMVWRDPSGRRLTGLTHVRRTDEVAAETITVAGTRLDALLPRFGGRVRFIKMDIEGAELLALRGAEEILRTQRPLLYCELDDAYCQCYGYTAAAVFDYLATYDYRGYQPAEAGAWHPVGPETYAGKGEVWFIPREQESDFIGSG